MKITAQLIKKCINKESKAQRELYDLLLPYIRAVVQRYLSDSSYSLDILQETFIKIFNNLSSYDAKKSPFKNWAAKIAVNHCINFNQRTRSKWTEPLEMNVHEITLQAKEVDAFSDEFLLILLKHMPPQLYNVFNLYVIDEYSHAEIAVMLSINEANSRKILSRAKQWLKKVFVEEKKGHQYLRVI